MKDAARSLVILEVEDDGDKESANKYKKDSFINNANLKDRLIDNYYK